MIKRPCAVVAFTGSLIASPGASSRMAIQAMTYSSTAQPHPVRKRTTKAMRSRIGSTPR